MRDVDNGCAGAARGLGELQPLLPGEKYRAMNSANLHGAQLCSYTKQETQIAAPTCRGCVVGELHAGGFQPGTPSGSPRLGLADARSTESKLLGLACFHSTLQIAFRCISAGGAGARSRVPAERRPGQPRGAGLGASLPSQPPAGDAPAQQLLDLLLHPIPETAAAPTGVLSPRPGRSSLGLAAHPRAAPP